MSEMMAVYRCKKITLWERLKLKFSRKYQAQHEIEQKRIIREMLTEGKDRPIWPREFDNF